MKNSGERKKRRKWGREEENMRKIEERKEGKR